MALLPNTIELLSRRVLDISYENKVSYYSSTLSTLPILLDIYNTKQDNDLVILSNSHAGLALYVILEHVYGHDAVELLRKHGLYPLRDVENHIYFAPKAPGIGLSVAIGQALADPNRTVYCVMSDGECGEGSVWEGLRFINDNNIKNIEVHVVVNGSGSYDNIEMGPTISRLVVFCPTVKIKTSQPLQWAFAPGINSHHHIMTEQEYQFFNNKDENEKTIL